MGARVPPPAEGPCDDADGWLTVTLADLGDVHLAAGEPPLTPRARLRLLATLGDLRIKVRRPAGAADGGGGASATSAGSSTAPSDAAEARLAAAVSQAEAARRAALSEAEAARRAAEARIAAALEHAEAVRQAALSRAEAQLEAARLRYATSVDEWKAVVQRAGALAVVLGVAFAVAAASHARRA